MHVRHSRRVRYPRRRRYPRRTRHVGRSERTGAFYVLRVVGLVLALGFAFPAAYLVYRNFTEAADPAGLIISDRAVGPLWRSLRLAVSVSVSALVLGTGLAWLTIRTDLRIRRLWRVLMPLPLVFPSFVGAAALIHMLNPGGLANEMLGSVGMNLNLEFRGFTGAWFALTLMTYPYVYLPVAGRLRQLPCTLEDSARVLGNTVLQVFRRVCVLQMASAVGAGTLLVFLYTLSDFGAVQIMRYDTLTRAIAVNQLANPSVALALSMILLVLAMLVVLGERRFSRRLSDASLARSDCYVVYNLGRWRWPATCMVAVVSFTAVGVPMIAVLDWAMVGFVRSIATGRALTIGFSEVLNATVATLSVSLIVAVMSIAAVMPIAFLAGRYRSRSGSIAHTIVIGTFALPGILIAFSMRFWTLRSDLAFELLNNTMALLIFAYVVRFGSLAMGTTLVAVRSVPNRLHDSARILKAGRIRRLFNVDMPIMRPGLIAGAGLVLLSVMKELPISLFVSPLNFSTLTTRIFGSLEDAFITEAGIMTVVLVSMSFLLTWLLVIRRDDLL